MKSKSTFSIQDKNFRDLDNQDEYLTLADLMKEQGLSTDLADYWDKECELNPSNPHCLEYDDQLNNDLLLNSFHINLFSIFYLLKLINFLTRLLKTINLGKFMSGDYETLEVNQPKISYFKKRSEDNTLWLDEMINKIEDMKNNILDAAQYKTNKG